MEITKSETHLQPTAKFKTFEEAKQIQTALVWKSLEQISVEKALEAWLFTLSHKTQINYRSGINQLVQLDLISLKDTLQMFALVNHESIIDRIKLIEEWSECSRQARAACYISFTRFLHRRTQGMIKHALANREGNAKTFYRVREKVKTNAMTRAQWTAFLEALETLSFRDCLAAKLILQGGKRVSEVLALRTDQIDWGRCKITYVQSKTRGVIKKTVITYAQSIMDQLRLYIGERTGLVLVTRNGKALQLMQLTRNFAKAGKIARVPFKVTPHVLRATTVTYLKQQGFQDSDIMKVTGHANPAMVHAYDKTSQESNASEKVHLVS